MWLANYYLHTHIYRYCSNYYRESSEPIELCDWCQSEGKISRHGGSSSKKSSNDTGSRSEYSGEKMIKQNDHREDQGGDKGKNPATGAPSPRTATRRYKLLKDVMCWMQWKLKRWWWRRRRRRRRQRPFVYIYNNNLLISFIKLCVFFFGLNEA